MITSITIALLLVTCPLPSFAENPVPFGREFEVELVQDSVWNHCELLVHVSPGTVGTTTLTCSRLDSAPATHSKTATLTRTEVGTLRTLLQQSRLFEGQFWGTDARSLDFGLVTLRVADGGKTAILVTSLNPSFEIGSRKTLMAAITKIRDGLLPVKSSAGR